MASINVSERDFEALVGAAWDAKLKNRHDQAAKLDKLARKVNAALTNTKNRSPWSPTKPFTWQDVPSVFDLKTE